jgi:hypothetical protein
MLGYYFGFWGRLLTNFPHRRVWETFGNFGREGGGSVADATEPWKALLHPNTPTTGAMPPRHTNCRCVGGPGAGGPGCGAALRATGSKRGAARFPTSANRGQMWGTRQSAAEGRSGCARPLKPKEGLNGAPVRNSRDWTDRGEKSPHSRERKPQGLKPASFWGCCGTTESRAPSRFVAVWRGRRAPHPITPATGRVGDPGLRPDPGSQNREPFDSPRVARHSLRPGSGPARAREFAGKVGSRRGKKPSGAKALILLGQ